MEDNELGGLVARDVSAFLAARAPQVEGPVYAISLWVDDLHADYGIMLATQASLDRRRTVPAYRGISTEEAMGPAFRWYSGDWDMQPQDFLSPQTQEALAPLVNVLSDVDADEQLYAAAAKRWRRFGYTAIGQVQLPTALTMTTDALCYAELPDLTLAQAANFMLHTVAAHRFHEVIPAWRRLATAVRADPAQIQERAQQAAAQQVHLPTNAEPPPDNLTVLLRSCGLHWHDLATWNDRLQQALTVADQN